MSKRFSDTPGAKSENVRIETLRSKINAMRIQKHRTPERFIDLCLSLGRVEARRLDESQRTFISSVAQDFVIYITKSESLERMSVVDLLSKGIPGLTKHGILTDGDLPNFVIPVFAKVVSPQCSNFSAKEMSDVLGTMRRLKLKAKSPKSQLRKNLLDRLCQLEERGSHLRQCYDDVLGEE